MRTSDRAYLAGFFDGEGNVSTAGTPPRVRIQVVQKHREILDFLHIQSGRLGYIVVRGDGRHAWAITDRDQIAVFVLLTLPYAKVKRDELFLAAEMTKLTTKGGRRPVGPPKVVEAYERAIARRYEIAELLRKRLPEAA